MNGLCKWKIDEWLVDWLSMSPLAHGRSYLAGRCAVANPSGLEPWLTAGMRITGIPGDHLCDYSFRVRSVFSASRNARSIDPVSGEEARSS